MMKTGKQHETSIRITNSHAVDITIVIEPWGEIYELVPADRLDVVAEGPDGGALEVDFQAGKVIVWAWPGSTVRLFRDGVEIGGDRTRSPSASAYPPTTVH
jgi:hypothetical protein